MQPPGPPLQPPEPSEQFLEPLQPYRSLRNRHYSPQIPHYSHPKTLTLQPTPPPCLPRPLPPGAAPPPAPLTSRPLPARPRAPRAARSNIPPLRPGNNPARLPSRPERRLFYPMVAQVLGKVSQ